MMTTKTPTDADRARSGAEAATRALLVQVFLLTTVAVALTVALAGLSSGTSGLLGAGVGAGLVLAVLAVGCGSLALVAKAMPQATLLVALLTYLAQATVLTAVFVRLSTTSAFADGPARVWLALGLVVGTLAWVTAQVLGTVRARIPAYDLTGGEPGE